MQHPDDALDTSGPCKGYEDLADETLLPALSALEEFGEELTDRGANMQALIAAVKRLLSDIEDWRAQ